MEILPIYSPTILKKAVEILIVNWGINCKILHGRLKEESYGELHSLDYRLENIRLSYEAIQAICSLYKVENPLPKLSDDDLKDSLERVALPAIDRLLARPPSQGVSTREKETGVRASPRGAGNESGENKIIEGIAEEGTRSKFEEGLGYPDW